MLVLLNARSPTDDLPHYLVSGNHPGTVHGQFVVDDMKVSAADSAGFDLDQKLVTSRLGHRTLRQRERRRLPTRDPGFHCLPTVLAGGPMDTWGSREDQLTTPTITWIPPTITRRMIPGHRNESKGPLMSIDSAIPRPPVARSVTPPVTAVIAAKMVTPTSIR
jgi:hypothetical protein